MGADEAWQRIEDWLRMNAPISFASLRPGAAAEAIADAARTLGVKFPPDLVTSLLRHDGCEGDGGKFLLPGGDRLLSVQEIVSYTEMMRDLGDDDDEEENDLQSGWYWHPQYLQVASTIACDALVVDCRPGEAFGQIGDLFEGEGTTFPEASSLGAFLTEVADCLERGRAFQDKLAPVVIHGALTWHRLTRQAARPVSLLELAAAATEPAPQMNTYGRLAAADGDGWAGEYTKFCLTFVHGLTEAELLERFGALPGTIAARTRTQAADATHSWTGGYRPTVRVGRCGDWAFAIEEDVWEGARDEVARRVSAGTRLVSIRHWGGPAIAYYQDGELVTSHNTRLPDQRAGSNPDLLTPALKRTGLLPGPRPHGGRDKLSPLCEIARTELGVTFDTGLLARPLTSAQVLPLLTEIRMNRRRVDGGGLDPAVAAADSDVLRTALMAQMRSLATETGLDTYPEVLQALARAEAGDSWTVEDQSPLGLRLRNLRAEAHAAHMAWIDAHARDLLTDDDRCAWISRANAGDALRSLLQAPPLVAADEILPQRQAPTWHTQLLQDLTGA